MQANFRVVDVDCHQIEPQDLWTRYLDAAYRDRAPVVTQVNGHHVTVVEGETCTSEGEGKPDTGMYEGQGKYAFSPPEFKQVMIDAFEAKFQRARAAGFSAESRLLDMDDSGIGVQVIYPTSIGLLLGRNWRDVDLLAAICRAFNDWTADYCSADPKRLRWAAALPMQSPELAIEEMQRTVERGATSFYLRPNPSKGRNLYHPDFLPFWDAVQESGRAVSIHDSASPRVASFGDRMDSHTTGHMLSHPFEAMATMAGLIWFGIFERFPGARVVHVESDGGWVPYWLQRMEQHYQFSGTAEHPLMNKPPTDYFRSNVWVAFRGDEPTLPAAVELVGDDKFLFNTDYPHPDGTWPGGLDALLAQPISDASKQKILWDNAVDAYRLSN
jgi:predicted TIM-barrel fold metal-dependent hydrolase